MNPKEKAKELYDKMVQWQTDADIYIERNITSISAKHSALIAVDEIINELKSIELVLTTTSYISEEDCQRDVDYNRQNAIAKLLFLDEVKQEIRKL